MIVNRKALVIVISCCAIMNCCAHATPLGWPLIMPPKKPMNTCCCFLLLLSTTIEILLRLAIFHSISYNLYDGGATNCNSSSALYFYNIIT